MQVGEKYSCAYGTSEIVSIDKVGNTVTYKVLETGQEETQTIVNFYQCNKTTMRLHEGDSRENKNGEMMLIVDKVDRLNLVVSFPESGEYTISAYDYFFGRVGSDGTPIVKRRGRHSDAKVLHDYGDGYYDMYFVSRGYVCIHVEKDCSFNQCTDRMTRDIYDTYKELREGSTVVEAKVSSKSAEGGGIDEASGENTSAINIPFKKSTEEPREEIKKESFTKVGDYTIVSGKVGYLESYEEKFAFYDESNNLCCCVRVGSGEIDIAYPLKDTVVLNVDSTLFYNLSFSRLRKFEKCTLLDYGISFDSESKDLELAWNKPHKGRLGSIKAGENNVPLKIVRYDSVIDITAMYKTGRIIPDLDYFTFLYGDVFKDSRFRVKTLKGALTIPDLDNPIYRIDPETRSILRRGGITDVIKLCDATETRIHDLDMIPAIRNKVLVLRECLIEYRRVEGR